jgi:hypothetical protein
MNKPPNPPAFPNQEHAWDGTQKSIYASEGMTLRDYFAAKALLGIIAGRSTGTAGEEIAPLAYEFADDMLRARSKEL